MSEAQGKKATGASWEECSYDNRWKVRDLTFLFIRDTLVLKCDSKRGKDEVKPLVVSYLEFMKYNRSQGDIIRNGWIGFQLLRLSIYIKHWAYFEKKLIKERWKKIGTCIFNI
jgi:hypothetical protein